MYKSILSWAACAAAVLSLWTACSQKPSPDYERIISYTSKGGHHVQGIAVDTRQGYVYLSFTTSLVKTDMKGNVVGSVSNLLGHLGCLTFNPNDGKVYGSLEYKDDEIGRGLLGSDNAQPFQNLFYVAIIDGDKIVRQDMDYKEVMTAVCLPTVVEDYAATPSRYACTGIDGITFGPAFGQSDGSRYLTVAYGIKGDRERTDNDYNVLLQYDIASWSQYAKALDQDDLHQQGPATPAGKYFVYTGSTNWGVQNLEYDPYTHNWFMFVYSGRKRKFWNHSLYIVDGNVPPTLQPLKGMPAEEQGMCLSLLKDGLYDEQTGIYSWISKYGSCGFAALGGGYYYIVHDKGTDDGQMAKLYLYEWTGNVPTPFRIVK